MLTGRTVSTTPPSAAEPASRLRLGEPQARDEEDPEQRRSRRAARGRRPASSGASARTRCRRRGAAGAGGCRISRHGCRRGRAAAGASPHRASDSRRPCFRARTPNAATPARRGSSRSASALPESASMSYSPWMTQARPSPPSTRRFRAERDAAKRARPTARPTRTAVKTCSGMALKARAAPVPRPEPRHVDDVLEQGEPDRARARVDDAVVLLVEGRLPPRVQQHDGELARLLHGRDLDERDGRRPGDAGQAKSGRPSRTISTIAAGTAEAAPRPIDLEDEREPVPVRDDRGRG